MLYIITEDSNSARDFWNCVANCFRNGKDYMLVPLINNSGKVESGNKTLNKQVSNLFSQLKQGDTLFVAFDNIGSKKNFNSFDFIQKTKVRCNRNGINFAYTTYYCFEELFLSYIELMNMYEKLSKPDQLTLNTLRYVVSKIKTSSEYYDNSKVITEFISKHSDAGKNKEHFANTLLIEVTKFFKGSFRITKSKGALENSGKCWIKDCRDIRLNLASQYIENVCNKMCKYSCKNCNTLNKLNDLDDKSLMKYSKIKLHNFKDFT